MRIRLKTRFFFQGHMYEPGEIVDLPDGVEGPHGSQQLTHERISYDSSDGLDANRLLGRANRIPLFDVVEDNNERK